MITSVLIIAALALGPAKSLFQQHGKSVDITENYSAGNTVTTLQFDADSAYAFTAAQCDFGPRNMNSDGHDKCKKWIINKFRSYGCEVMSQDADLRGYDGTMLKSSNIIARHRTDINRRIMLCAHWDSRPWADNDPDPDNWHKPGSQRRSIGSSCDDRNSTPSAERYDAQRGHRLCVLRR